MADWIIETITQFGYLGIFLLMLLEAVFPPIPSELIIPFAGFAAARGDLTFIGVLASASLGSLAGMLPWYLAGRLFGLDRVRRLADRYGRWLTLNATEIDHATGWFVRFGPAIVLFGRLLPIIRTLISVPAGLARMPALHFVAASAIGIVLWNTVLVTAGYVFHEHYHLVEQWLDPLALLVMAGVGALYLFRLVTWKPSRLP
jgi:membrane protein DedA with SNARE-associated domain